MADEMLSQEEIEDLISGAGNGEAGAVNASSDSDSAERQDLQGEMGQVVNIPNMPAGDSVVRPAEFSPLSHVASNPMHNGVDLILDVQMQVAVELGRTKMRVKDVLSLGPGSVVELDKHAGEPVEVVVNNKTVARGEVVVIDENFGVRVTEIINVNERDVRAKAA